MQFIQDNGNDVFRKKNYLELRAVKFLILIASLIEELQVIQEKLATYQVARRMNEDLNMPRIVVNFSFMEESVIFDKFGVVFLSFLVCIIVSFHFSALSTCETASHCFFIWFDRKNWYRLPNYHVLSFGHL